jgi:hypothetical protein
MPQQGAGRNSRRSAAAKRTFAAARTVLSRAGVIAGQSKQPRAAQERRSQAKESGRPGVKPATPQEDEGRVHPGAATCSRQRHPRHQAFIAAWAVARAHRHSSRLALRGKVLHPPAVRLRHNPSLERTSSGKPCKPAVFPFVHRHTSGLRGTPPGSAQLAR